MLIVMWRLRERRSRRKALDGRRIQAAINILVLRQHREAITRGSNATAHIRHAVDVHHAIGARSGKAEQPAWTAVLIAPRKGAYPGTIQGGGDGIGGFCRYGVAVPLKEDLRLIHYSRCSSTCGSSV